MNNRRTNYLLCVSVTALATLLTLSLQAATIVDDSWSDGNLAKTGALDSNWWTSASSAGIEVSVGSMGMVTGTSGRGIHTVFPTQTLANVGDKLTATYTFTTPATIGSGATAGFRVGLFDTLGRAGLDANVSSSSGSPNLLYGWANPPLPDLPTAALPGYMMDMDIGTGAEDLSFREHSVVATANTPTGRLMGTSTGFASLSPTGPDGAYVFAANTTYTGSLTIARSSATEMELTGTLGTATHTITDEFDSASFGMLAFWANSNIFGSSSAASTADNGIDFSNVNIEYVAGIPEPSAIALLLVAMISTAGLVRRRSL